MIDKDWMFERMIYQNFVKTVALSPRTLPEATHPGIDNAEARSKNRTHCYKATRKAIRIPS